MKKKGFFGSAFGKIVLFLLLAALAFGVYEGVGYLRGLSVNRVYGREAKTLTRFVRNEMDDGFWLKASQSVRDTGRSIETTRPDKVEPYIVIQIPWYWVDQGCAFADVIACSGEKKPSLDGIKTVVFCCYTEKTATYNTTGSGSSGATGTSEFVRISYVDAETGLCYDWEEIGRELPATASSAPHYKVSTNELLAHIKDKLGQ